MGSEWSIIMETSFCGILPWQAGGKVTRRPLGRKLLGKYLTVFSHSATPFLIATPWPSSPPLSCLVCIHLHLHFSASVPLPGISFMFPRTGQVEQVSLGF